MLLAIDPGAYQGWACFLRGALHSCGLGDVPAATAREAHEVVIEMPQIYPSRLMKGDPNDIITLAFRAGVTAGMIGCKKVISVKPTTWKGQVPKSVHHARVKKVLEDAGELCLVGTSDHNVWDAICLGLWYLKRTGKGGVAW